MHGKRSGDIVRIIPVAFSYPLCRYLHKRAVFGRVKKLDKQKQRSHRFFKLAEGLPAPFAKEGLVFGNFFNNAPWSVPLAVG